MRNKMMTDCERTLVSAATEKERCQRRDFFWKNGQPWRSKARFSRCTNLADVHTTSNAEFRARTFLGRNDRTIKNDILTTSLTCWAYSILLPRTFSVWPTIGRLAPALYHDVGCRMYVTTGGVADTGLRIRLRFLILRGVWVFRSTSVWHGQADG